MALAPSPFSLAADRLDPPEPEHAGDPIGFVRERLNEYLWSVQEEILNSVWKHQRTAVPSCFASGKSFTAARAVAAWVEAHPPGTALVVTTSTTFRQVKHILWKEIRRAHAKGNLRGRVNQTEWYVGSLGNEEIVAFGQKPADSDPAAFQGHHEMYVLVIVDEADGVGQDLMDAVEGLLTNEDSRVLLLGNPWNPTGAFAQACKPGSGYNVIRIDAFSTPNFTDEDVPEVLSRVLISKDWVEDKKKRWGVDDPRYISKVLAHFPQDAEGTLIHLIWMEEAQKRKVRKSRPIELGVDVAGGTGGDESVIVIRRGGWARVVWASRTEDTTVVANQVLRFIREFGPRSVKIDAIGIGKGVYDTVRKRAHGIDAQVSVVPVTVAAPRDPDFASQFDELAWGLRQRFEDGEIDIDPDDEEIARQVIGRKWETTAKGQIKLESKKQMKTRGLPSPDRFDGLVLAFAPLTAPPPTQPRDQQQAQSADLPFDGILDEAKVGF